MIFTGRFLWLLALGGAPLLAAYALPPAAALTPLWNLLLAAAAFVDFVLCPRPDSALEARREAAESLSVATQNSVKVSLRNLTRRRLKVLLRDEPPPELSRSGERQAMRVLPPQGEAALEYSLTPPTRGDFSFGDIFVRVFGPLGLVVRQGKLPAAASVAVFPNIQQIGEYKLNLRRVHRARQGVRRLRTAGVGREFSSLRDYVTGDEFRVVDWKASARRGKLTSRTFETERAQDVLLLIDVGRLMRLKIENSQKLDHVVSAALMLAHVAASADDRVGLLTFAEGVRTWLPPRRGRAQTGVLLRALYDTHAQTVESDYRAAFRHLSVHWRKRSLVVLFTDLSDPDTSAMLLSEITLLAQTHLVCCVTVRDPLLSARARQWPEEMAQVFEKAVAAESLAERGKALALLERQGLLTVDAEPEHLSAELVARYLSVKSRGTL